MFARRLLQALGCLSVLVACAGPVGATDWPMSRYDASRSAASPEELPAELQLQWSRDYPALKPAWPDQPKMPFDAVYDPVVVGRRMFVASSWTDSVTALDTETGAELWQFFTEGPVRFAPVIWRSKVYFVSDDGYLYCLDANRGTLLWKFRGGPADRRILGNERLVSTWPARGAPVIADGTVYFAASIWPFMGIFIHAVDANSGKAVWTNSGDGSIYMKQPHGTDSFASIAPQGPMVVAGDLLLIPGGRSVPAVYDRKTGKLLRYQLAENGKRGGGSEVAAIGKYFFNGGAMFELAGEKWLGDYGKQAVLTPDVAYIFHATGFLRAYDLRTAGNRTTETKDSKGKVTKTTKWVMDEVGSCKTPALEALIKAGSRLYGGAANQVVAVKFPPPPRTAVPTKGGEIVWQTRVDGTVGRLVAANGKLFAVTVEGRIYCFAGKKSEAKHFPVPLPPPSVTDEWTDRARGILEATNVRDGYCVAWGIGSGRLVRELIRHSQLHVIVIDPDEKKVKDFRKELAGAGLYGKRVAVHAGAPLLCSLPPYFASLMVSEELQAAGVDLGLAFVQKVFASLRPYGGVAWLPLVNGKAKEFVSLVEFANLPKASVRESGDGVLLSRDGALPGSGNWTHEHADAANTRVSRDELVKAPLGVLWFGGPSHDGILPRHGHGPQPQVVDGKLIIEGVDMLRCMDIYTGRVLWETRLPGVGGFYNNMAHQPGANAAGTNYISTADGIYVVHGKSCIRLDPATGKKTKEFTLPPVSPDPAPAGAEGKKGEPPIWGYINVTDNLLIGGADPWFDAKLFKPLLDPKISDEDRKPDATPAEAAKTAAEKLMAALSRGANDNMASSRHLVVMDRHTGEVLWTVSAQAGFRHNGVCVGGGRLYAIDCLSGAEVGRMKKRGENPKFPPRLLVLDLKTGKEIWKTDVEVFGTWLSYSAQHDVLVEAGRNARDTLTDEAKGIRVYRADSGLVLWTNRGYLGPAMIHGDMLLKDQSACELLTGKPWMRTDPITGQPAEWKWIRNYGCNTPAASEHLLTFRSGAAGYFDLCGDGGTGNFGGFRSSCTNNLIVAGGTLTAPDYTRTCTCSYQNQCSIALVHMPEAEMWTSFGPAPIRDAIRRVGIAFGAPGDRKAPDGTLWVEYPSVGGPSPVVPLRLVGTKIEWFRRHSSLVDGELNWVAASGVKGLASVTVLRGPDPQTLYMLESLGQAFAPLPVGSAVFPVALGQVGLSPYPTPRNIKTPVERKYTVRLHFMEPDPVKPGERVFSVNVQGKQVIADLDVVKEAGGSNRALVKEVKGVTMAKELTVSFSPAKSATNKTPILSGIELVAEGW